MYKIITEATMSGLIVLIIGKMVIGLTMKKDKTKSQPKGIELAFFLTGLIIHFVAEYIGLNGWYCDKKCITGIKRFV